MYKLKILHDIEILVTIEMLPSGGHTTLLLSPGLLLVHLDDIVLLHFQGLWGLVIVDAAAVKQETEGGDGDADPLAVGLLEFAHLGGLLHPEVDLVGVLADHLELDVLGLVASHRARCKLDWSLKEG